MNALPASLVAFRCCLGPVLLWLCLHGAPGPLIVAIVAAAGFSDLFDGILARRLQVATERLRVADSWVDTWFYAWVAATLWLAHRDVVWEYRWPLASVLGLQLLCWAIDLTKYGRFATYHAYTAKAWGVALGFAAAAVLGFGRPGPMLWIAVVAGWISLGEGIALTLILPRWTHDVMHVGHALALRRQQLADGRVGAPLP